MTDPSDLPSARSAPDKQDDAAEYQKRLDRLTEIFRDIAIHAQEQAQTRCPYKDKHNYCTAKFGCRNQRKNPQPDGLRLCGGDDKIDYRKAWETS